MESGDASVVRLASQQRAAEPGEPTCAVCGRFGEYICDATDEDVCSLECRDVCTKNHANALNSKNERALDGTSVEMKRAETSLDHAEDSQADARTRLQIQVEHIGEPTHRPPPLLDSFDSLPEELRGNLAARGFQHPTTVQMQTIPAVLTGSHVLVNAPTGAGKTAAFLVPLVMQIMAARSDGEVSAPFALVLVPVRELAMQIEDEAKALMKGIAEMKTALLVGGLPIPPQLHRLCQGVQLLVATPGRLVEILVHHSEGKLDQILDHVRICVVDEVDMMLSVGFNRVLAQIVGVLSASNVRAQMIFTSATISEHVEETVMKCLGGHSVKYMRVRVGQNVSKGGRAGVVLNADALHSVLWREEKSKKVELFRFLQENQAGQTLVFVDSRAAADMLAKSIEKQCYHHTARSFHGGKSQEERLKILEDFVDERVRILVSTNVLGRGIDLLNVDNIVIFDAPKKITEYVHIVGRVRRGQSGTGLSVGSSTMYVNSGDKLIFPDLVDLYRTSRLHIPGEVYGTLRASAPQKERKATASVAVDDAKRAYRVIHDAKSDGSKLTSFWGPWKSKKRTRYG